jgi:hypothetical protein
MRDRPVGEESRKHSAKVSEDLKDAVFRSAELLIQVFLTDVRERLDRFAPEPALLTLRMPPSGPLPASLYLLRGEPG